MRTRLTVLLAALAGCGGRPAVAPAEMKPPNLDALRALISNHTADRFSPTAQAHGCPADETIGDYVGRLVKYGAAGDGPDDVHSLTGGCVEWPATAALVGIDPPLDRDYWYCTIESRASDPDGESPWHYDLRIRVRRGTLDLDWATAGCGGGS